MLLDGQSAVVTGGASGLGLATGAALVERGASVVIVDLPSDAAEEAAANIGARFVPADVLEEGQVEAALDAAESNGPLRAAVHCAGRGGDRLRIIDRDRRPGSLETFADVVRTNLVGT